MFLILLLSLCAQAEPIKLKTTEVTAPALLELGFSKTIKPTEEYVYHPQYSHLSDALNNFSSLQARSIGSPTFSIRGSQSSARVLSLLEGVPLNLADGFGPEPLFIPYENLESVTVLKGSSASTFGKDAMAGAINFNLNQSQGLYTKLSYSSFNTKETYVRHGGKEIFVSAFHSHSDGNYPYKIDRLNLSGTTERNNQETLRLSFKYVNKNLRSLHLISRQIGTIPGPADFPSPSNFNNIGHLHSLFLNFSPIVSQTSMTISEKKL
ncbi:MAG: Plug domain-containing protein [Oligoflexia bacterium]|nr:Plug domain-containing protein [Oligoflexia bacterium]